MSVSTLLACPGCPRRPTVLIMIPPEIASLKLITLGGLIMDMEYRWFQNKQKQRAL